MLYDHGNKNSPVSRYLCYFNDESLETNYFNRMLKCRCYSNIFLTTTVLYSLSNFVILLTLPNMYNDKQIFFICILLFAWGVISALINRKSNSRQMYFFTIYLNYIILNLSHFQLSFQIDNFYKDTQNDSTQLDLKTSLFNFKKELFFLISLLYLRIAWIFSPLNNLLYLIISNLIVFSTFLIFSYFRSKFEDEIFILMVICLSTYEIALPIISHFIQKYKKTNFYQINQNSKLKSKFLMINKFNNGYLKFKNKKLLETNKFFDLEFDFFSSYISKTQPISANSPINLDTSSILNCDNNNSNKIFSSTEVEDILKEICSNMIKLNPYLKFSQDRTRFSFSDKESLYFRIPDTSVLANNTADLEQSNINSKDLKSYFTSNTKIYELILSNKQLFTEFSFFGKSVLNKTTDKILSLEILVKIDQFDSFEIIINDVTKNELKNGMMQFILKTGQFLHDFKNPLICIHNEMHDMKEKTEIMLSTLNEFYISHHDEEKKSSLFLDFDIEEHLEILEKLDFIKQTSEYCQSMIGSYEDFSKSLFKPQSLKIVVENFDLMKLIKFLSDMMNKKLANSNKNVKFLLKFENFQLMANEQIIVGSDESKLKRVLVNILLNAEKFTSFGTITLTISKEVILNLVYYKFVTQDTGMGMREEELNNLFTPFVSYNTNNNNKSGCGLGLTIIKEISEHLGRGLKISSEYGKGTKVIFDIEDRSTDKKLTEEDESTILISNGIFNRVHRIGSLLGQQNSDDSLNKTIKRLSSKSSRRSLGTVLKYSSPLSVEFINTGHELSLPIRKGSDISLIRPSKIMSPIQSKKTINIYNSYLSNSSYILDINRKSGSNNSIVKEVSFDIIALINDSPLIDRKMFYVEIDNIKSRSTFSNRVKNNRSSKNLNCYFEQSTNENSKNNNSTFKKLNKNADTISNNSVQTAGLGKASKKVSSDKFVYKEMPGANQFNKSMDILIIDNEQSIRSSYKNILMKFSASENIYFDIDEADDGFTGISQIFRKAMNSNVTYDLIICDDLMTFLDGKDVFRIMSFITENHLCKFNILDDVLTKFLFCSSDSDNLRSKLTAGTKVLEKPLTCEHLKKYIVT